MVDMKQYSPSEHPVSAFMSLPGLAAMITLMALAPAGNAYCDGTPQAPSFSASTAWNGSASVDSDQGTSLHLQVAHVDIAVAMSVIHATAGTAGFPGFSGDALEDLESMSIGLNLDSPWLVAGDLGLAGLGQFIFRPAGAGPLLPVSGRKPLRAERPDATRYRGFVLGKEGGLMAVYPLADPLRVTSGAWFSPSESPLSVIMLAGTEPGHISDDWYEADRVTADRLWGAASLGMTGKWKQHRLSLSGALAASAGLPGSDAMTGRLEAMLAIRRIRLDAEASLATRDWRAPDGVAAVPFRLDASALYRYRGLELSGAYHQVRKDAADAGLETGLMAHAQLSKGKREFRLASTFSQAAGQNIPALTLDTRCKPGLFSSILPDLILETSWKAKDGLSERFDTGASLKGGRNLQWSLSAGLRYDTQGRHMKGAASVLAPLGGSSLHFVLGSDGWIPPAGEQQDALLVLSVTWSFSSH